MAEQVCSDKCTSKDKVLEIVRQTVSKGIGLVRLQLLTLEVYEFTIEEESKDKENRKGEAGYNIFLTLAEKIIDRGGFHSPRSVQVVYELVIFVKHGDIEDSKEQLKSSLIAQREIAKSDAITWGGRA
ncbi:MAG: hypothetical protein WCV58_00415 [Patescibacteria group bacterium]